ncbi:hypothetical protein OROGR_004864 [Orobanche gracilis]
MTLRFLELPSTAHSSFQNVESLSVSRASFHRPLLFPKLPLAPSRVLISKASRRSFSSSNGLPFSPIYELDVAYYFIRVSLLCSPFNFFALKFFVVTMAIKVDDVSVVTASKDTWNIVTKLVLMDSKGCKIHASFRRTLVYRFKPLLTEGHVYQISYFGVGDNVDIIGILTGSSGEQEFEKDGKGQKKLLSSLIKMGYVRLECTFFGDYVGLILGQLASGDMTNAVVVVQYAKIKPFRAGRPSVQNVFFESNDPTTQVLSQLQDSRRVSITQEFLNQTDRKSIEHIKDLTEKITCVVLATIKFIPEWNPWWYPTCKCNKKVIMADGMYFCENCVRHIVTPSPRYKLQVRFMDHTESTTFIIFDQEASTLLNRSCASFVKSVTKDPADYPVPPEVLALIDKTFLFKIEVNKSSNSKFEPSYRVKKVCSDEDVITQFKSTLTLPDGSNLYQVVSTPTSVLRGESSSSSFYKNLDGDFGFAENSPNVLTTDATTMDLGHGSQISVALPAAETANVESTPSKRPSPPYDEALGSSNVVKKPLMVIKKEKI